MRSWFPLADYDFWGYLVSGAIIAFALTSLAGIPITSATLRDPLNALAFAAGSYTLGHANAALAAWLFENIVVAKLIGTPLAVLTGASKRRAFVGLIAPSYRPLPEFTIGALKARLRVQALPAQEEIFQRAYHYARRFADARDRIEGFRNQYGFCRNATLAVLIAGWCALPWATGRELALAVTVVGTATLLFARYLKFYRLFAVEILSTFAFREADNDR